MAVYPFYVKVDSSSRKEEVGVGCRTKEGYLRTTICQRNQGAIETPYKVEQTTYYDMSEDKRKVKTTVSFLGNCIHEYITDY